jgi:hypothetical protein
VRCFGKETQTLDLADANGGPAPWTILVGNNGTGKTTILQSLAAFQPTIWRQTFEGKKAWVPSGLEWSNRDPSRALERIGANAPVRLSAQLVYGAKLGALSRAAQRTETSFMPGYGFPDIRWVAAENEVPEGVIIGPECYGYGAGRRLGSASLSRPESDEATATLFSDKAELLNAEEWLLQTDYSASKPSEFRQRQRQRLEQVGRLLIEILPEVDNIRFDAGSGARPIPKVEFHTPYGWVPLRQLGYGYQTLIGWMVDFASRMVERYPDSPDPLAEPAVVLVDEIDLHLHPTWQRKLIGYLTERFPNTQFIATAHSPLIVQAAKGANLVLLRREGDQVVIDNDFEAIHGWTVDQVLTSELFGLESSRPPEFDDLLAQRTKILTKSKLTEADRRELARLEKAISELPGGETAREAREMLEVIKENQRLLRAYQASKS